MPIVLFVHSSEYIGYPEEVFLGTMCIVIYVDGSNLKLQYSVSPVKDQLWVSYGGNKNIYRINQYQSYRPNINSHLQ